MRKLLHLFTIIIAVSFLSFCALFLLPPSSMVEAAENTKQETVVLSRQQYENSMKILEKQEVLLTKLKWRMELLETPLDEQLILLEKCETELSEAKTRLEEQKDSLTSASNSIVQLKQDLEKLKKQVDKLERQSRHRAKQRDFYLTVATILASIVIVF